MGVTKVVQNSELKQFALIQFIIIYFNWTAHNTEIWVGMTGKDSNWIIAEVKSTQIYV